MNGLIGIQTHITLTLSLNLFSLKWALFFPEGRLPVLFRYWWISPLDPGAALVKMSAAVNSLRKMKVECGARVGDVGRRRPHTAEPCFWRFFYTNKDVSYTFSMPKYRVSLDIKEVILCHLAFSLSFILLYLFGHVKDLWSEKDLPELPENRMIVVQPYVTYERSICYKLITYTSDNLASV